MARCWETEQLELCAPPDVAGSLSVVKAWLGHPSGDIYTYIEPISDQFRFLDFATCYAIVYIELDLERS